MTIYDLIDDRPLTDPELVRTVLRDTIPGPGAGPELCFLLCDLNGHLLTPLMLQLDEIPVDPVTQRTVLDATIGVGATHVSAACCVVRHGPIHATPTDRLWQEAVQRYCQEQGIRDLGFFVMGTRGIDQLQPLRLAA
ncbi:hypothetical protein [Arsenicicoccus dermatophilus]|uniref:hypothetical protein n=1 Tax=Arsenicicoccus dermatophilus TaxID=1076331 RepID=UPI001F4CBF8A|nr:hypothetical protein [Arsenicicoccus dermatophilus]MCH8611859.1 hypothetical protein [Arsenicicoccus dermatophilus]